MIFQVDAVVERSEKLETLEGRTEQLRGESQIYTEVTRPGRVAQSVRERSGSVVECLTFVGPDLGPNCLQRLSADDKI